MDIKGGILIYLFCSSCLTVKQHIIYLIFFYFKASEDKDDNCWLVHYAKHFSRI